MKRFSITTLFLITFLCCFSSTEISVADVGEWTREPIWDVSSVAIADDHSLSQVLWIVIDGQHDEQLFRYNWITQTWTETNYPSDDYCTGLHTFPDFPNLLFLSMSRHLYKTENGGEQWFEVYTVTQGFNIDRPIYQQTFERFIMLISDGELLVSYDQGDTKSYASTR